MLAWTARKFARLKCTKHLVKNFHISNYSTSPIFRSNSISIVCKSAMIKYSNLRHSSSSIETELNQRLQTLAQGILSGNRRDLSRGITLIESTHPTHQKQAQTVLNHIYHLRDKELNENKSKEKKSFRIGITGPPGTGKSTFVNKLGLMLCEQYNNNVAVLAIDPSSFITGGSILGDQTRMLDLFRHPNAYVRPSPNRLSVGGVTDTCYEVSTLCESAGYDVIFIETVGVGQAEIEVANCVDLFVLIIPPTAGDDLQGLKRGIMEMADIVIVNKCDGDLITHARHIKSDYQRALRLINQRRKNWMSKVLLCSSLPETEHLSENKRKNAEKNDIISVWNEMLNFQTQMQIDDAFDECRIQQRKYAAWKYVWRDIRRNVDFLKPELVDIEREIMDSKISPREGSQQILHKIWANSLQ